MNKNRRSLFLEILFLLSVFSFSGIANEVCLLHYQITMDELQYRQWQSASSDLHKKISFKLEHGVIQNKYYLGTGMTETYLVKFAGDYSGIYKPYGSYWKKKDKKKSFATNPHAEVLASEIAELTALAHVPVTVYRDIENMKGSLQLFMPRNEDENTLSFEQQLREMKIFDFLINNQDRRNDNIIISGNYTVAIDHSQSFSTQKNPLSETELKIAIKSLSKPKQIKLLTLSPQTLIQKAQSHQLTNEQTQALESRLKKLKDLILNK